MKEFNSLDEIRNYLAIEQEEIQQELQRLEDKRDQVTTQKLEKQKRLVEAEEEADIEDYKKALQESRDFIDIENLYNKKIEALIEKTEFSIKPGKEAKELAELATGIIRAINKEVVLKLDEMIEELAEPLKELEQSIPKANEILNMLDYEYLDKEDWKVFNTLKDLENLLDTEDLNEMKHNSNRTEALKFRRYINTKTGKTMKSNADVSGGAWKPVKEK